MRNREPEISKVDNKKIFVSNATTGRHSAPTTTPDVHVKQLRTNFLHVTSLTDANMVMLSCALRTPSLMLHCVAS